MSQEVDALKARADAESRALAEALDAVDRLASFALPLEQKPELEQQVQRINALWSTLPEPAFGGMSAPLQKRVWDTMAPQLARQQEFNSALVQLLNTQHVEQARVLAHLRELVQSLVRWVQRVDPAMDARDRLHSGLATTRSELILEAFDRRQETFGARLDALLALRDRLETVSEEARAIRSALSSAAPPAAVAASAAAEDSLYAAFENRYRGDAAEIRERLASYVPRLAPPVHDLGCGRGELLALLKEAGVEAHGVDGNAAFVQEDVARGLDVKHGNLVDYVAALPAGSAGSLVAIQVAEHLPPPVLLRLLREAHRALRPGGQLILETVNPRSVIGLLEVFNRDLTHERPLHPDTLSFLAAAAGFTQVAVEMRAHVEPAGQLQHVPTEGLPPRAAQALNENVARLNAFLYGPQEYALVATR